MGRLIPLLLSLLLIAPALCAATSLAGTIGFLVEFLSGGRRRPLSAATAAPSVRPLAPGTRFAIDLHAEPGPGAAPGLVLVHGLSPRGKDEPPLVDAARLLARAGWAVAVPTVPGLTALRLRPEDAGVVVAAVRALSEAGHRPISILAISVGAGPALLAATDPAVAPALAAVLLLGGYASARELLRYTLTGAYRYGPIEGRRAPEAGAIALFARANAELVDAAGRQLVDNRDPAAVDGLLAALPPATRRLLDDLSPDVLVQQLAAPLFLVHGRDDATVPYTETLRLRDAAQAAGRTARAVIVGAVGHVEPDGRGALADVARLAAIFHAFRRTAGVAAPLVRLRAVSGGEGRQRPVSGDYLGRPSPISDIASRTGS